MGQVAPQQTKDAEPHRGDQARRLGRARRRLFLARTAVSLLVPVLIWRTGLAEALWGALIAVVPPLWAARLLYVGSVLALLALAVLPFAWYGGHVLSRRFGLSRQRFGAWLADWLKATAIGLLLGSAGGLAFYTSLDLAGPVWWLPVGALASAVVVGLAFLAPYVLVPLFFRMRPVEDETIAEQVQRLANRAGASVSAVCTLDFSRKTAEANAAVIGLGRSRRVVLADTLLETFSPDEIAAVVAHELGHHVQRDMLRLLAVQFALLWGGLFLAALLGEPLLTAFGATTGLADPTSLPLLLALAEVFSLSTLPIVNLLSRRVEASADAFALRLTSDPGAFAAAMSKLASQNLAELSPPRWAEVLLHSHPSIARRIEAAERWASVA